MKQVHGSFLCLDIASQLAHYTSYQGEYHDEYVKNGFFDSISALKSRPISSTASDDSFNIKEDYRNILNICQNKKNLPNISLSDSFKLLRRMKNTVNDLYSISTLHYLNAGNEGVVHFHFLSSCAIAT